MDLRASFNKYRKAKLLKIKRKIQENTLKKEIEKDYMLEIEGNAADFLRNETINTGPKYSNGKLVPYSIIGPSNLFMKKQNENSPNRYKRLVTSSGRSKFALRSSVSVQNSGNLGKFSEVIRRLKEIREKEKEAQKNEINFKEMIDEDDSSDNSPETYGKNKKKNKFSMNFSEKKVRLTPIKSLDFNNFSVNSRKSENKYKQSFKHQDLGNLYWYMSLRGDKTSEQIDTYMRIGNEHSGLYTKIKKPNPIFDLSSSDLSKLRNTQKKLEIAGKSKLELELEAVEKVGIELLRLDLLDNTKYPEQIIAEKYDYIETPRIAKKSKNF